MCRVHPFGDGDWSVRIINGLCYCVSEHILVKCGPQYDTFEEELIPKWKIFPDSEEKRVASDEKDAGFSIYRYDNAFGNYKLKFSRRKSISIAQAICELNELLELRSIFIDTYGYTPGPTTTDLMDPVLKRDLETGYYGSLIPIAIPNNITGGT